MIADPLDLVFNLTRNVFHEAFAWIVECAGKHKVLEDHDAGFITQFIETFGRVIGAAPDTDPV